MVKDVLPTHFRSVRDRFPKVMAALDEVGTAARQQGPLDSKTAHLVQLAESAAIQSEGAVHSHVQRATAAGATPEEIYHAVVLLVSTMGFPRVAAALSWVDDVLKTEDRGSPPRRTSAGHGSKPQKKGT